MKKLNAASATTTTTTKKAGDAFLEACFKIVLIAKQCERTLGSSCRIWRCGVELIIINEDKCNYTVDDDGLCNILANERVSFI